MVAKETTKRSTSTASAQYGTEATVSATEAQSSRSGEDADVSDVLQSHAELADASAQDKVAHFEQKPHRVQLLDLHTAKAILAETFDEDAEADRDLPPLHDLDDQGKRCPLPGIVSLYITAATLEKIGCSQLQHVGHAGHGLTAEISKERVLADIQSRSALSDFHAFRSVISTADCDPLHLRVNNIDLYADGSNFELATSAAAVERWAVRDTEVRRRKDRDARVAMRHLAAKSLRQCGTQRTPRPWMSHGSEADVDAMSAHPLRAPAEVTLERPRLRFGPAGCNAHFENSDADGIANAAAGGAMEHHPHEPGSCELLRRLIERDVQAAAKTRNYSVQATPLPARNNCCQYVPRKMSPDTAGAVQRTAEYGGFLRRVRGEVMRCLLQNAAANVHTDEFAAIADEEALRGTRGGRPLHEALTFFDIRHCKGMRISAIHWHPHYQQRHAAIVAVAQTSKRSFAEKIATFGRRSEAAILLWNFADLIHPEIVLSCPSEATSIAFNPAVPDIIAAGCQNGAVVLWEVMQEVAVTSHARAEAASRAWQGSAVQATDGSDETGIAAGDGHCDLVVEPKAVSIPEAGHRAPVAALTWLPHWEVTSRGALTTGVHGEGVDECAFFASCASDGKIMFWDCRADSQRSKKRRNDDGSGADWRPVHIVPLLNLSGSDLACTIFDFDGAMPGDIVVGSADGELAAATFVRPADTENPEYTRDVLAPHAGCVTALVRHPYLRDVILSVGGASWHLWRGSALRPLFTHAYASEQYTAATWSPTREAVLFLGLADGTLECWDLLDRSHEPALAAAVAPSGIRAIAFNAVAATDKAQMLAVGDDDGTLRIIEVPSTLRRPVAGEHARVGRLLDMQALKLAESDARQEQRDERRAALLAERQASEDTSARASTKAAGVAGAQGKTTDDARAARAARAEAEYRALEAKLKEQLGLSTPHDAMGGG